jgi:hypothetical protein
LPVLNIILSMNQFCFVFSQKLLNIQWWLCGFAECRNSKKINKKIPAKNQVWEEWKRIFKSQEVNEKLFFSSGLKLICWNLILQVQLLLCFRYLVLKKSFQIVIRFWLFNRKALFLELEQVSNVFQLFKPNLGKKITKRT